MRFTAVSVVSLLAGSIIAAPTDMNTNKSDMSADASSIAHICLANLFSERQMAVLRVLSEHQQELGMSQEEKDMMDAFMAALHDEAAVTVKRQAPVPAAITGPSLTAVNATALGSLGSVIGALNGVNSGAGAPTGIVGAVGGAANLTTDILGILKGIPGLTGLLGGALGTAVGATPGLGSATSGLSGLTGGLGSLNGSLGGLTGGLGGLAGGLGGLCGSARRGGLLGGILIPGLL